MKRPYTFVLFNSLLLAIQIATPAVIEGSGEQVSVPTVVGLTAAEAKAAVRAAGLVPKFQLGSPTPSADKSLTVYAQNPDAGKTISRGEAVELTIYTKSPGSSQPVQMGRVPTLVGQSARDAKAVLAAVGLLPKFHLGSNPPLPEQGLTVSAQDPSPGTSLAPGSPVQVTLYAPSGIIQGTPAGPELTRVVASAHVDSDEPFIDPHSGELSLAAVDLEVQAGLVRLEVRREFQTRPGQAGLLGTHWRLNWESRFVQRGNKAAIVEASQVRMFSLDEAKKQYRSLAGDFLMSEKSRATWTRTDGTTEYFDGEGRLIEREDRNGNKVVLYYDAAGRLARVEGPFGSFLEFVTDTAGRLTRVDSSTGATVRYFYGVQPSLALRAEDGQAVNYAYDANGALMRIEHPQFGATEFTYEGKGRVTSRRWADGAKDRFEYDDATHTRRHIDPAGGTTTTRRSAGNRRIEITDPLNRTSAIESDDAGRPLVVTGPTGLKAHFTYDTLGRPTSTQDAASGTTRFEYLGNTRLPTLVDASDGRLSFAYNVRHNLLRMTHDKDKTLNAEFEYYLGGLVKSVKTGDGQKRFFTYDTVGRRASVTDAAGSKWRFEYDGRGNLLREIDPLGGITTRNYDTLGRLTRVTDTAGGCTRLEYAQQGRHFEVALTDPRGGVTRSAYDQQGRLVSRTGPGDRTTRWNYNASGELTSLTDAGQTYRFEHDACGNLLQTTNPRGGVTKHTYDLMGRLTSIADPAGGMVQYEYSPTNRLIKSIDGTGRPTEYEHDSQGRLLAVIDDSQRAARCEYAGSGRVARVVPPSGPALDLSYDDHGHLASVRRGEQVLVCYEYDVLGRRTKEKRATGLEILYRHDALGNLVAWEDNHGGRGRMEYDGLGRAVAVTDASGATTRFKYDPAGSLQETTSPLKQVKRLAYNEAGRLSEVAEPNGDKARYDYDSAGRLTIVHHPAGGQTTFAYDPLGKVARTTDALGNESRATYDAAGRLTSTTDPKGQTTTFTYNTAGRLTQKRLADGKVVTYRYDARGNLRAVDDGTFPIRYTHDIHDRLTRIEYPAIQRSLSYEYNAAGLQTKFVDSEGQTIRYEYDAFDRLTAMKYGEDAAIAFAHDAKNRLTSVAYPNGVKGIWQYDADDRVTKLMYKDVSGKVVAGWTYSYDVAGNREQTMDANGRKTCYRYDPSGQLTEEDSGDGKAVKYGYLPGGNRGTRHHNGETIRYRYDKADRLLEAGAETFLYDANGNLVERKGPKGVTRYTYDAEDRLVKIVLADRSEVRYEYAPTGERVSRRDASGMTYFVTDGMNLWAELGEDLKPKATYLHRFGVDQPLVLHRGQEEYFYHVDFLGSVAAMTDRDSGVAATYGYDAFGAITSQTKIPGNPFTYTSRESEPGVGLYYYRARYYDSSLGRFLATDPLKGTDDHSLSLNPYIYVLNNPLRYVDPAGLANLSPKTHVYHYTTEAKGEAIHASRTMAPGTVAGGTQGEVHWTTIPPNQIQPTDCGLQASDMQVAIKTTAGKLLEQGYFLRPNPHGNTFPQDTAFIVKLYPGELLKLPPDTQKVKAPLSRRSGARPGRNRGGFIRLSDPPEWATGPGMKAGGIILLAGNLVAGVIEQESLGRFLYENTVGMAVGTVIVAVGVGAVTLVLGSTAGGLAIVGVTLYGAAATGKRLGTAIGDRWGGDDPVQGPESPCEPTEIPSDCSPQEMGQELGLLPNPEDLARVLTGETDNADDVAQKLNEALRVQANARRLDRALTQREQEQIRAALAAAARAAAARQAIFQRPMMRPRQHGQQHH